MEGIRREKQREKDILDVPHDIIGNILLRLDVKSLLRFKIVSRKWEAMISDPVFAQNHLLQSKSTSPHQYILRAEIDTLDGGRASKFQLVQLKNQEFQVESTMNYPQEFENAFLLCCLDGLLLLSYYKNCSSSADHSTTSNYALWNPSIATFIILRCPYSLGFAPNIYGIYQDPLGHGYKVVMGTDTSYYAVFNSKNKCWTDTKQFPISKKLYRILRSDGVYFNGSLYWALNELSDLNQNIINFKIICFDLRDEEFKKVRKPRVIQNNNSIFLILLGGHLCLYRCSMDQLLVMIKDDDRDSWMEFISIQNVPLMSYPWPLFMTDENEIVLEMLDNSSKKFIAYNPSKRTFQEIKTPKDIKSFEFPFVGSLVLDTRRI